ncbi:Gfo/Idh/MocA family protein [Reyranella sp. CPCC 100927]|uniref:Gfo/Idh/MocA family protein n=1 Tax=Reyranella sp. CPCC 100927 TaxID=2599616 RepID=UPI0015B63E21|nr:Gfo/Idh/MocA family oxidoreductase [Reyranella sp. CPCC 100927]
MVSPILETMPSDTIRVAIIGLGKMGTLHLHTCQRLPGLSVSAVVDSDPQKEAVAQSRGVPFFRTCDDLPGQVDAAIVATPANEHVACATFLAAARIHCLVEKPLAMNVADSKRLVAIAAQHRVVLAVGHSERFNVGVSHARKALATNVRHMEVFRMAPWSAASAVGVDVVQDLMIHDLDWVVHGLGEIPRNVKIRNAQWHKGKLACVSCTLDFASGRRVGLTASHLARARLREALLYLDDGAIDTINLDAMPTGSDALTLQIRAFLAAINGKTSGIATGREILSAMALSDSIRANCEGTRCAGAETLG